MCFHTAVRLLLLLRFVAKDMRSRAEVAALGKAALKVTLGTWGYWREPEGKSHGPWPVSKSMLRAPLWQEAQKGKPVSPQGLNVRELLGSEVTKSRVVPASAGVTEAVAGRSPYRYPLWLARALNGAIYDAKWDYEGYRTTARIAVFYVKIAVFYIKFPLLYPIL